MNKIIVAFFFCLFSLASLNSSAQVTFRKILGGAENDIGYAVLQSADSGYVISGGLFVSGTNDVYLIRTDKYGDTLWVKRYGATGSDISYDIIQGVDNNGWLITGTTSSFGAGGGDIYLIRVDSVGDTVWTRTYGGTTNEWAWDIQRTVDNGYIFAGQTASYGAGLDDIYVIKIDSLGDTLWTKTYGDSNGNATRSLYPLQSGGFFIMGDAMIKIDNDGNVIWSKNGLGSYIERNDKENYCLVSAGNNTILLTMVDTSRNILWSKSYSLPNCFSTVQSIGASVDNGFIVAGDLCSTAILGEAFLMRVDSIGNLLWAKIYKEWEQIVANEITKTTFYEVRATSDGGFIAVGEASNFFTRDVYIVKVDANGNSGCSNDSSFFPVITNVTLSDSTVTVQVGSGGILGSTATIVNGTNTTDSTLCFDTIVGIKEQIKNQNEEGVLLNFPNPFSEYTSVEAYVPDRFSQADIIIYSTLGIEIKKYPLEKGYNILTVLPEDLPASGIYLYVLRGDNKMLEQRKMIVFK